MKRFLRPCVTFDKAVAKSPPSWHNVIYRGPLIHRPLRIQWTLGDCDVGQPCGGEPENCDAAVVDNSAKLSSSS